MGLHFLGLFFNSQELVIGPWSLVTGVGYWRREHSPLQSLQASRCKYRLSGVRAMMQRRHHLSRSMVICPE